ncbi:transposase [Effusibacillus consociatus]|uniref:Transposase n=1 Tax=Effusibacillus consociatus TaxID=1117041 RepID=A0ABV9Q5Z4_9BACL
MAAILLKKGAGGMVLDFDRGIRGAEKIEPIQKINRDLLDAAQTLTPSDLRYLVDSYYQIQEHRKRAANQVREIVKSGKSNPVIEWMFKNMKDLENNIRKMLDVYTNADAVGRWSKSITGIGPVIAAGLLAHIDIEKAPTVGHIWRFAGLDPTTEWKAGHKRPWNAKLKRLSWIIGQSFVKVSNNPKDIYGHLYKKRKLYEQQKNEAGDYAELAKQKLKKFNIRNDTEAFKWYSKGRLPPAHIDQRAQRWAVKLFLSHWHEYAYKHRYGEQPPKPYAIEHLGHVHLIAPPNYFPE